MILRVRSKSRNFNVSSEMAEIKKFKRASKLRKTYDKFCREKKFQVSPR